MTNIILAFENAPVTFTSEAYLNATQIAKHFNKRVQHYLDNERTQEYIEELSKAGNPAFDKNQLVIVKKGSSENGGGTWLHPKLTIDFARAWLTALKNKTIVNLPLQQVRVGFGDLVNHGATAMCRKVHGLFYALTIMVGGVLGDRKVCRFRDPVRQPDTSPTAQSLATSDGGYSNHYHGEPS